MFEKCHFGATVAEAFFFPADVEAEWNSTMVGSCGTTTEHQMGSLGPPIFAAQYVKVPLCIIDWLVVKLLLND